MAYKKACELCRASNPQAVQANARYAKSLLEHRAPGSPLRCAVAAQVLIDAAANHDDILASGG